ncbi:hypothetical protein MXD63_24840 [Frankia sp. Cpl3]|nr:hypothetical protein [Frankia sp. Cpl3]
MITAAASGGGAEPPVIALQPYEGQTVRSPYETFAPGRQIRRVPEPAVRGALRATQPAATRLSRVAWISRRMELLLPGQQTAPTWLDRAGFRPLLRTEAWPQLAGTLT